MKEKILLILFSLHSIMFLVFFLRKRRKYNLIFLAAFIFLAAYNASILKGYNPEYASCLRYAGIALCAIATPFFLCHVFHWISGKMKKKSPESSSTV
ncbi:MAG: hypothetical protein HZA48_10720 [Planctomycetes bacterium]|nr:hypothetical protein [Planctomycetota bacterium]